MTDKLLLMLPAVCDRNVSSASWWRVTTEGIAEEGVDEGWVALVQGGSKGTGLPLVALAPAAAVRLAFPDAEGATERQQAGVARAKVLAESLAEPDTLHAVSGHVDGQLAVALVGNGQMIEWLDWLSAHGADPEAIIAAGLAVPRHDEWTAASVGADAMLARADIVLPDEPALREAIVGEAPVTTLTAQEVAALLVLLAQQQPLNLRTSRFARRRLFVLDRARLKELAVLTFAIPLIGLAMALVMIARLERSSDRLEAETARLASGMLGQQVAAAAAIAALDTRISSVPGASGSPFVSLTAVYQTLQQVPGVTTTTVSWRADGTLVLGLAATRTEDINRLLLALQRTGYRVTATSRAGSTGQTLADVTVRGAP